MGVKVVRCAEAEGWNFSLHPRGPLMRIKCGECHLPFEERVGRTDYPVLPCPFCRTANRIPITWS